MDPERGRCRRTDGKKWRCSRDVLPDQKYCERHMHRGRQRSRKPVEVTEKVTKSNSLNIVNSKKTPLSIEPPDRPNKISNSFNQLPAILQPIHPPSSNVSYKVCSVATPVSTTSSDLFSVNTCSAKVKIDSFAGSTAYITTYSDTNGSFKMKRGSKNILSNSESSNVAPGSDVRPKGVLVSGVGCDTSTTPLTETPLMENEPERCRRTDGRKWRCSSEVLPDQKYCILHMHRGVKKLTTASNPVTIAISPPPLAIPKNLYAGSTHGTAMSGDKTSTTSESSSDATTITDDENTSDSSKYIIRARDSNINTSDSSKYIIRARDSNTQTPF